MSHTFSLIENRCLYSIPSFLACALLRPVLSVTVDARQPSATDSLAYHSILSLYYLGFNSYSSFRINVPLKMVPVALDLAIVMKSLKVLVKLSESLERIENCLTYCILNA